MGRRNVFVSFKTQSPSLEKQWMLGHTVAQRSLAMWLWVRTMYAEHGSLFQYLKVVYSFEDVKDSDQFLTSSCRMKHVVSIILCATHQQNEVADIEGNTISKSPNLLQGLKQDHTWQPMKHINIASTATWMEKHLWKRLHTHWYACGHKARNIVY